MPIKISYQKETQKLSKIPSTFSQFTSKMVSLFNGKLPQKYFLEYENKMGERIEITSDTDYKIMLENEMPHQLASVRVYVLTEQEKINEKDQNLYTKHFSNGSSVTITKDDNSKDSEGKDYEEIECDSGPGLLSLFNSLISDNLPKLDHICSTTEKNNKETKITINFKRKDEHKNGAPKAEVYSNKNDEKMHGHFKWGDIPMEIRRSKKKGEFIIDWNRRDTGEKPSNTEMKAKELEKYLPDYIERINKVTQIRPLYFDTPLLLSAILIIKELPTAFIEAYNKKIYYELSEITELIRRLVSSNDSPPIKELSQSGILPHLCLVLDKSFIPHKRLMNEACWILANVAAAETEYVQKLINLDIIPKCINLLDLCSDDVNDNILWILANISGDTIYHRDLVLKAGIVPKLEKIIFSRPTHSYYLNNITWLFSNLCRSRPYPEFSLVNMYYAILTEQVSPLLKLVKIFLSVEHPKILSYLLWTLAYLSDGEDDQISLIFSHRMTPRILELLDYENANLQAPALRTIGNLLTGDDIYTQVLKKTLIQYQQKLVEEGVISKLQKFLSHKNPVFVKEACWAFSNILTCDEIQIQLVIQHDEGKIITKLLEIAYTSSNDVKKLYKYNEQLLREAMFCFINAISIGTPEQIHFLIEKGLIRLLIMQVEKEETQNSLLLSYVESIYKILDTGREVYKDTEENPYVVQLEELNGLELLEKLQYHPEKEIYEAVTNLIDEFFSVEEIL